MTHTRLSLLALALALTGCPQPMPGPGPTSSSEVDLQDVLVSGMVVGGDKGRFRIELTGATSANYDITVTTTGTGVTFPATVQVPAGKSVVEGEFTATTAGASTVVFASGTSKVEREVRAVGAQRLNGLGSLQMQTGATTVSGVSLAIAVPKETTITLTSSDASVASVPMSVTVQPFRNYASFTIKAGTTSGTTRITSTLGSLTDTGTISVTNFLTLNQTYLTYSRVLVDGLRPTLVVTLSGAPATPVTVTLTSSNPSVGSIQGTATMEAGNAYLELPITVGAPGTTHFTVDALGETRESNDLVVLANNVIRNLYCGTPLVGEPISCSLNVDAPVAADTQITLSSSATAVATVPAVANLAAGNTSTSFRLTALTPGPTVITATMGNSTRSVSLNVTTPETSGLSSFYVNANSPAPGSNARLQLFSNDYQTDRTITLTSSDPTVLAVPASVVMPTGSSYFELDVPILAVGQTLLTASANGVSLNYIFSATNARSSYLSLGGGSLEVGAMNQLNINIPQPVATDTTITITNSAPTVLSAPSSLVIRAGQTSVQAVVRGLADGDARLSASLNGQFYASDYRVVAMPTFNLNVNAPSVGSQGQIYVSYNCELARDRVITLSQMGMGHLNMATSIIVPTGGSSGSVTITSATAGDVTVTATQGMEMHTQMSTIQ